MPLGSFGGNRAANAGNALGENIASNIADVFSTKRSAKYLSSARTVLRINGRLLSWAAEISWDITAEGKDIFVIDDYVAQEIAPTRVSVAGSIGGFRVPGSSPTVDLIQADIESFMMHKYITIEVRDSKTNHLIFYTNKAQIVGRKETVANGVLSTTTLTWRAIGWKDEREPKPPIDKDIDSTQSFKGEDQGLFHKVGKGIGDAAGNLWKNITGKHSGPGSVGINTGDFKRIRK